LPSPLADIPLTELAPKDVRGLQAELLAPNRTGRALSVKTVKNAINGTLRAFWREAIADELVTRDIFAGLQWPAWDHPEPEPFSSDEMRRILGCFQARRFGFPPLPALLVPPTYVSASKDASRAAHRQAPARTVAVLRAIEPLHVAPDTPVFTSTAGGPIEPKSFSEH